ncbi:hypothetical protein NN561_003584 [Cricetulus griseus]
MAARPPSSSALRARASPAPRHGLGRGSAGFAAPATVATVATAAVRAAASRGDGGRAGGCDRAAAILTTNRRRVLGDGNQAEHGAGPEAVPGPERPIGSRSPKAGGDVGGAG